MRVGVTGSGCGLRVFIARLAPTSRPWRTRAFSSNDCVRSPSTPSPSRPGRPDGGGSDSHSSCTCELSARDEAAATVEESRPDLHTLVRPALDLALHGCQQLPLQGLGHRVRTVTTKEEVQ